MASYTYPEAAAYLRVEERWLRRNISRLPHSKKGRTVTFTQADLDRIDQMHHHEPTTGPLAAPPQPSAVRHPLAHLRPLPSRRSAVRV
ncbi:helix-turn-helix domain-containing protein [Streptomyces thermolilacinus]|uniref:helix-turn-helix domain-containing protein n=1 Tax=Streptomyces thermolilacinus TaxID=285540 RepID=UPI0033C1CAF1